jgi:glycosyltransferase involved in cell wall biosynthesis
MKKNKKLLYIDVPFIGEKGGDKGRSRFIWDTLQEHYDCDLLLINHFERTTPIAQHHGFKKLFELNTTKWTLFQSHSFYNFKKTELAKFAGILKKNLYDVVFLRFSSPALLTPVVEKILPKAKVVLDIDMLFSRLSKLSWQTNPSLKNRYYLLEFIKQRNYEFELFARPYLFFFTNFVERDLVEKLYMNPSFDGKLEVIPNVMRPQTEEIEPENENYILFYGDLSSAANRDAFIFLAEKIYPLIAFKLKQQNIRIKVVGKNRQDMHTQMKDQLNLEHLEIVGEVADINSWIASALLAVLPIRIASGTRTRILEAAWHKTAVVTTTIGAEGFEFDGQEILIADTPETISQNMISLLEDSEKCKKMGEKFHEKAKKMYLDSVVAEKMINSIDKF